MSDTVRVLALIGSLRRGSLNRMTYEAVRGLLPEGMTIEEAQIRAIPLYDDDVRLEGYPEPARRLRGQIAAADAVLFISPEYNYSVPGVLKNAIDWASRPPDQPFARKPVGIMGASAGVMGTARMQYHLRQILVSLDAYPINRPEVAIGRAQEKFDAAGKLVDEATSKQVRAHLDALAAWTRKLRG
jgi:chromate reductase